jgi:beta-lactam-binding protein with PASTA domain
LGYEPQYTSVNSEEVKIEVPTLTSMSVSEARKAAEAAGFTVSVKGTGTEVVNQLPKAGSSLKSGGIVILYTETDGEESKTTVPNFTGMRKSEAVAAASSAGLSISAVGGGASETVNDDMVAVKQSPVAGAEVSEGSSVTVNFAYDNND